MDSTIQGGGGFWRVAYVVFLGQLVSIALALMSFNSSNLSANLGVNAPFTLGFCSYTALTVVYGSILLFRRQKLQLSWYWYLLLAVIDVQGNFLINKAFQLTSITSVTLLDCWTVVWVIILTYMFLGTKYSLWQFFGAALCVSGLCLVLLSDSGVGGGGGSNPILGDIIVIVGTCFFAFSNVGEEFCVKRANRVEVVAMFALFAMLVSMVEIAIFDRKNLEAVSWSPEIILTFVAFGIAGFTFSSLTPIVLKASGATLFNLSVLTADLWTVVIRVFLYHQKVDWLYYVSFLCVGIGLFIYSKSEKYSNELPKLENCDTEQPYKLLPEEAASA